MMKKLSFILIFLLFTSSAGAEDICASFTTTPKIKVTTSYGKLEYNFDKSTKEITDLAEKFKLTEKDLFAEGLSTANVNFDITINTLGQPIGNNQICLIPTEINIFLGLDKPVIYISNELSENSCKYNVVLQHEKVHQQINVSTLEYYLPMFRYVVLQLTKDISPILITDINEIENTTKEMTQGYNQKLLPLVNYIKREMLIEQQKLDNTNNYLFENMLCP